MSLGLGSSAGSSYASSGGTGISRYQKSSDESDISHCKQFLENILEDGGDHTKIEDWIQRAECWCAKQFGIQRAEWSCAKQFGKELVVMIDQSVQEINSKHEQAQASDSDMHSLMQLAGVMTTLAPSPDLLPTLLRLYLILESFPVSQVNGIANELRKSARENLHWFYSLVQNVSNTVAHGGGIHRITSYVMNYVKILWEYDGVLNIILAQDGGESENAFHDEKWTRVDSFVQHLIGLLDTLLERMTKYELMGLKCISLLNNAHFILNQLQKLEMKSALQKNWILKYNSQVEHQITIYLDLSWQPVCSCLDAHTWTQVLFPCFHPHPLTIFYAMLESTCAEQQDWKIEDPKLRHQVREAVSSRVIRCYQSYLQLQKKNVKFQKHVLYTPQEIENNLMELFEG